MNQNKEDKLDWMYKGANSHVHEEEYLLGKSVDKTFEQLNIEKKEKKLGIAPPKNHVEHECIPPSIRDFNKIVHEEQVDLSAKLQEDPLAAIKKQEEEARRQFLQNPIQLKKLQEALEAQKKKKKKKKRSNSEYKLDKQLSKKLKYLKSSTLVTSLLKNDKKENHLDTILMHKFNQLKDKLSPEDMDDILAGRCSSDSDEDVAKKKFKTASSNSDGENSEQKRSNGQSTRSKYEKFNNKKRFNSSKEKRRYDRDSSSSSENEKKKYRRESNITKNRRDRSSSSEHKKEKYRSKTRKHRNSSSSSENKNEYKKYEKKNKRSKSSDRSSDRNSYKINEYRKQPKNNSNCENDDKKCIIEENDPLDKMILEKLRMIRNSKTESRSEEVKEVEPTYSHYDSDNDEYVYKKKSFGLVRSDGTKIPLKGSMDKIKTAQKKIEPTKAPEQKKITNKKLSEKEKEEIRKQMLVDAVKRDEERSFNLKKFRQENKKEESNVEDFDKQFIHNQLSKSQKNITDVESRIKSKLNNIQRSSQHMNYNFSKRS